MNDVYKKKKDNQGHPREMKGKKIDAPKFVMLNPKVVED